VGGLKRPTLKDVGGSVRNAAPRHPEAGAGNDVTPKSCYARPCVGSGTNSDFRVQPERTVVVAVVSVSL